MAVYSLDTPLVLPVPDLAVVAVRRTELKRHATTLNNIYLPIFQDVLGDLIKELNQVDDEALRTLNGVPSLLDAGGLVHLMKGLEHIRQNADDPQSEAITQVLTEIDLQLNKVSTNLQTHAQDLDNALVNFTTVSFGDVEGLIAPINVEIVRIDAEIALIETSQATGRAEEAEVNKLIAALESVSALDKLKPLVENLNKLADIDPKNPLVGSIKAGIFAVSNILDLTSDALKYEHLVKFRSRMQLELDDIRNRTRAAHTHRDKETAKLEQLKLLQEMNVLKKDYAQELGKLHEALYRFMNYSLQAEDPEQRAAGLIKHAGILTNYIEALRRDWQRN